MARHLYSIAEAAVAAFLLIFFLSQVISDILRR